MKKDIYKLGGWLEKVCQEGIADDQALARWKMVQKRLEGSAAVARLGTPLMDEVVRSGFDSPETVIHLFIGGSELHGAKVGATDDLDIYGVFLDGPADVLGLKPRTHFVWSTATDDRRNGPEDVDLTLYSLHRWAELAAKGNATALHFVFADATSTSNEICFSVKNLRLNFLDLPIINCKGSLVNVGEVQRDIAQNMRTLSGMTQRQRCIAYVFIWNASS
jgi:hypothetical protein